MYCTSTSTTVSERRADRWLVCTVLQRQEIVGLWAANAVSARTKLHREQAYQFLLASIGPIGAYTSAQIFLPACVAAIFW